MWYDVLDISLSIWYINLQDKELLMDKYINDVCDVLKTTYHRREYGYGA
jgi:hypothetical protein